MACTTSGSGAAGASSGVSGPGSSIRPSRIADDSRAASPRPVAATMSAVTTATTSPTDATGAADHGLIPAPLHYEAIPGETFELAADSRIAIEAGDPDALAVAERFARWLRRSTGFDLPVAAEG